MINSVKNDVNEFNSCCRTALQLKGVSGDQWIHNMENNNTAGDELCLFLLGRIYFRHSTVLTKYSMWSTIDTALRVSDPQLISWSSIKLVYMGNNAYGILRPKRVMPTVPGIPVATPSGNTIHTSNVTPARGMPYIRRVGRSWNTTSNNRGKRLITPLPTYGSRGIPLQTRYQMRRRNTPLHPTPYVQPSYVRLMGTQTRHPMVNIPSQYGNQNRGSPARPLNQITTIPGYSFSNKTWTTTGWQPIQTQPMSPEVANLLQDLQCSSKNTNTVSTANINTRANTLATEDIPVITLDEEEQIPTEERQQVNMTTSSGTNPDYTESHLKEQPINKPTTAIEKFISTPVLTEESSRSSVDSTLELLHDFGKATTEHTNEAGKIIPSDPVPTLSENPSTISSTSEKVSVSEKHSNLSINLESISDHEEQSVEKCHNRPATKSENKNELSQPVKGIKTEQELNVKLEQPATMQPATSDWVPKLEYSNIIPKQEDVITHSDDDIKPKIEDDTIKPKSEEEDANSSLDFTLIDAGLIKSLMECNKPRPKPKSKRQKRSSKTKRSSKKVNKCTPLDCTINATSKQLFTQLRNIKLEVKREHVEHSLPPHRDVSTEESSNKPLVLSSLDDLDIPELKYPETFEPSVEQHVTTETKVTDLNESPTRNDITQK